MNIDRLQLDRRALFGGTLTLAAAPGVVTAATSLSASWTSEGFVERAGGRIHYVSLGEGEPLVLLHKLGGWVDDWAPIAPLLAVKRKVIAIDLPGHGKSTMLGPPPWAQTVAESTAMIKATLETLGITRCAIVGSSVGGGIGILTSAFWPGSVSKLALVSVSLSSGMSSAELAKSDAENQPYFTKDWIPLKRSLADVARFGNLDPKINDEENRSRAVAGAWVRPTERGVGLAGIARYLPRVQAPTLLVYGDRGLYTRFEAVGKAGLAKVEVAHIPNCGSFTYQEKPLETAGVLNSFLDS